MLAKKQQATAKDKANKMPECFSLSLSVSLALSGPAFRPGMKVLTLISCLLLSHVMRVAFSTICSKESRAIRVYSSLPETTKFKLQLPQAPANAHQHQHQQQQREKRASCLYLNSTHVRISTATEHKPTRPMIQVLSTNYRGEVCCCFSYYFAPHLLLSFSLRLPVQRQTVCILNMDIQMWRNKNKISNRKQTK